MSGPRVGTYMGSKPDSSINSKPKLGFKPGPVYELEPKIGFRFGFLCVGAFR